METLSKVFEDKYNKNVKDCTNEEIYHGLLSWTKEQLKGRGYQEGKKKTGKYNIVMVVNILYTKGVKQNHYSRIGYPAEGKCPQDRY